MIKLELSSVLAQLREEIAESQQQAEGQDIRFKVKNIDVELQVAVDWEFSGKGGGKIKFWVVDVNAEGSSKYTRARTHKIRLTLEPTDAKNPDRDGNPGELLTRDKE
ncbi:trypco2 family protein [Thiofilum flexile]|uniref:trypco2 family protein n=1 Tax=Thiofilum flexile TaxID=125627 RepID=UPI00037A62B2|nr:trypco2 family protein [Thiofilum flexile]